ncbi:MAG: DUF1501 domain-containing protein [Acidimicrobiales bacterium]
MTDDPTPDAHSGRPPVSRRVFLGAAGGVAGAAAIGGGVWAALIRASVEDSAGRASTTSTTTTSTMTTAASASTTTLAGAPGVPHGERVLVVVEMAGGNDALNTLVTADGRYRDQRPLLALAEGDLVTLSGTDYSLHPSLAALAPHWDAGSMAAVAGVGMELQSRSHFKAMDTWWSALPGGLSQTGWLGRWLDATLEGENDPLRAIALGGGSPALRGVDTLATVVRSPATFTLRTMDGVDNDALVAAFLATSEPLSGVPELAAAQYAIPSTLSAVDLLASASGDTDEADDTLGLALDGGNTVTDLLQTAAGIIDLGIGTRVITVGISGFDTHANQAGNHAALLADVGDGIAGFLARLEADGNADRVMVVTTSEFGRRVAENGSLGTDHGQGGCQFVFGPEVVGGRVIGGYDMANLVEGDLPTVVDTRSVYSAALDWLGGPTDEILDGPHDRLGLLST